MSELHKAILCVMKEIGYVQKEGKVEFGKTKYNYAGEADLIRAIRPIMIENNLDMYPSGISDINIVGSKVVAKYEFTMVHVESGESMVICALGEGMDSGDKASYKAATGALKYALRQTFIIETGDDPDKVSSEEHQKNLLDDQARRNAWGAFCKEKLDAMEGCESHEQLELVMSKQDWDKVDKKMRKDLPQFYDKFMTRYNEIFNKLQDNQGE